MPVAITIVLDLLGIIGIVGGVICARQLRRWERQLQGARVVIAYKGKNKMTPRLLDFLRWANQLDSDKALNGQVIYKLGGTTLAIIKPAPKDHGKAQTRTIKEKAA